MAEIQLHDPQTLYRRWEDSQWSPFEIDLERDRGAMGGDGRGRSRSRLLGPGSAHGRRGTDHTKFSGLVGSYDLNREELLRGFVEGYSHIHHDETRHIGYGVWFLREMVRQHEEAAQAVRETPDLERLGVSTAEVRDFALRGLTRRLDIIGVPLSSLQSATVVLLSMEGVAQRSR